jgi:hypothetical protein
MFLLIKITIKRLCHPFNENKYFYYKYKIRRKLQNTRKMWL